MRASEMGNEETRRRRGAFGPRFLGTGLLAVCLAGSLAVLAHGCSDDQDDLEATDAPAPIPEDVSDAADAPNPAGNSESRAPISAEEPAALDGSGAFALAEGSSASTGGDGSLGEGFVVWESNRSGPWRLWIRALGGAADAHEPHRLTPNEKGRSHCCAHVSPDGARLAYLSLPKGGEAYLEGKSSGPLHVVELQGTEARQDRVIAAAARTYYENRAVVWRSSSELIYIGGDGRSRLLDVETGDEQVLTREPADRHGWLLDPGLAFATHGRPEFSRYDRDTGTIGGSLVAAGGSSSGSGVRSVGSAVSAGRLGGCQPYFSGDGRWGFWVAGAGGPVNRIDLATGSVSTLLRKNDRRTVDGYGYIYFPMVSRDGAAFAYAASRGEHSHLKADYEIFIAAADPETLELAGPVRRITHHPAPDRFPDVYLAPRPLGRHAGEVPHRVALNPPGGGVHRWAFGDGATAEAEIGEHVYRRPGVYRVEARPAGSDTLPLVGLVRVRPAALPSPVRVDLPGAGREIRVVFDEPIRSEDDETAALQADLESGTEIVSRSIGTDSRSLVLRPATPVTAFDRLRLAGVTDRAQRPNVMQAVTLDLLPPLWPATRDGLVFLWEAANAPNLVFDEELGADRTTTLTPSGRGRLDRNFAMVLDGGVFTASDSDSNRLRWAAQATNELAIEMTVTPGSPGSLGSPDRALVIAGRQGGAHNFAILERGGKLVFSLRGRESRRDIQNQAELIELPPGRASHLVVTYSPGRLTLYLDGQRVVQTDELQGGFFHWRSLPLSFGGQGDSLDWNGRIEGVAIYNRELGGEEAEESHARDLARRGRGEPAERLVVQTVLRKRSSFPDLERIRPYRQALVAYEYEVRRVVSGPRREGTLRVAHWALLDGQREPIERLAVGDTVTLTLEPFSNQPQLEGIYFANDLNSPAEFFSVGYGR